MNESMNSNLNSNLSHKAAADFILVEQAIQGSQAAYTLLMQRYHKSVYHQMYQMVNNSDDAEDLTLEAFGKAFRRLESYTPNFAFSTWLFKIAINNCIDHLRKHKKRNSTVSIDSPIDAHGEQDFARNIPDHNANPEAAMIRSQKVAHIRALVNQLNMKYRLMVELRYYEEFSYEEIAQELNLPLGTVKAQLFRAKEILHQLLQQPNTSNYVDVRKYAA